ncbi:MAG: fumarylacetoacetate hydrolase family protein [Bacteroidales bacterium]|jgi:2-keto-4-pentenoate hydratase/2-oxohepta-3-ene-1,7-dioic acid hydratase in catechol pathway|nr:fumarylacetoacetate hydrolase family protein [Bacteroidales bacterium]
MKIICIARNYSEHAAEMGAPQFERGSKEAISPAFFLKPDSALLIKNQPFFYPDFSHQVEHEIEVVVRIDRVGKSIEERFAHKYYSSVALGIDFTARDLQREAKAKGLPWTLSKGFDGSAVVSDFVPLSELGGDVQNLTFSLMRNGEQVQCGNTKDMLCGVDRMISYISDFMLLRTGDMIYTGTPSGVGPVAIGDTLEGVLQGRHILTCRVK